MVYHLPKKWILKKKKVFPWTVGPIALDISIREQESEALIFSGRWGNIEVRISAEEMLPVINSTR